jgi:hypothetical protein
MPKSLLIATFLFSAVTITAPAFAFTYEAAPTNSDGSAKFTDPDDLADGMANGLSGSGGSTAGFLHMFGTGTATTAGVGMSHSNGGVVTPQSMFQRSYDLNDPITHE